MIDPFISLDQLSDDELLDDAFVSMPISVEEESEPAVSSEIYVPPLPKGVALDTRLASQTGGWVRDYVAFANCRSPMTPTSFHISAALMLASMAIARRLVVRLAFGSMYPNLWVVWLAATTLWGKTTALGAFLSIARQAIPHLLLPDEATPEALLADMAGRQPINIEDLPASVREIWDRGRNYAAQRGMALDEISGLLAGAGKDYNAGLIESFLKFFDGNSHSRSTKNAGWTVVRNPYLSLLGVSTPSAMAQFLGSERLWAMGWWPRFALLTPNTRKPEWQVAQDVDLPMSLIGGLTRLDNLLPQAEWPDPPEAQSVLLGSGVHDAIELYARAVRYDLIGDDLDHRLHGTYGRLPSQLIKVAANVAAMDWATGFVKTPGVTIELSHLAWAMDVVEDWRVSAHRVLASSEESEQDRLQRRVIAVVQRHMPHGASLRDLEKALPKFKKAQLETIALQLVGEGRLKESKNTIGRPTVRYMY